MKQVILLLWFISVLSTFSISMIGCDGFRAVQTNEALSGDGFPTDVDFPIGDEPSTEDQPPTSSEPPTSGGTPTSSEPSTEDQPPTSSELPTSGGTPTSSEPPTSGGTPTSSEPSTEDQPPTSSEPPTSGGTPTSSEPPTSGGTPTSSEPSTEDQPSTSSEPPTSSEAPTSGGTPTSSEPSTEDQTPTSGEVSSSTTLQATTPRVSGGTWSWGCTNSPCSYRFKFNQAATHSFGLNDNFTATSSVSQPNDLSTGTHYLHIQARDAHSNKSVVLSSRFAVTPSVASRAYSLDKISIGKSFTCALKPNGSVNCWGTDGNGQLGNGNQGGDPHPGEVNNISNMVQISAGSHHACALNREGRVACWGNGQYGKLGHGSKSDSHIPVWVSGNNYVQVSAGNFHTCAVRSDGKVNCWGQDVAPRLVRRGNTVLGVYASDRSSPTVAKYLKEDRLLDITDILQVAVGLGHTCGLTFSGKVLCWGHNDYGAFGIGSSSVSFSSNGVFVRDTTGSEGSVLEDVVQVTAGGFFSCALKSDGTVNCWGYANNWRLGGEGYSNTYPIVVHDTSGAVNSSLTDVIQIESDFRHTCALKKDGRVICWGYPSDGALGHGQTAFDSNRNNPNRPVVVRGISTAVGVSAGYNSSCALLVTGEMKCWGQNDQGQLGYGRSGLFSSPVDVLTGGVSSSRFHTGADRGRYACEESAGRCSLSGIVLSLPGLSHTNEASPVVRVHGLNIGGTIRFYSDEACSSGLSGTLSSGSVTLTNAVREGEEFSPYFKVDGTAVSNTTCFRTGLTFDRMAPAVPTISGLSPDDSSTPTVSGSGGIAGDTIKVYLDDDTCSDSATLVGEVVVKGSTWSVSTAPNYDWDERTPSGRAQIFYFYAQAVDTAGTGNESDCSVGEFQALIRP